MQKNILTSILQQSLISLGRFKQHKLPANLRNKSIKCRRWWTSLLLCAPASLIIELHKRVPAASTLAPVACQNGPIDPPFPRDRHIDRSGISRRSSTYAFLSVLVFSWHLAESGRWRFSCLRNVLHGRPTYFSTTWLIRQYLWSANVNESRNSGFAFKLSIFLKLRAVRFKTDTSAKKLTNNTFANIIVVNNCALKHHECRIRSWHGIVEGGTSTTETLPEAS